ncbi:hypothetical protein QBC43DRAFT_353008 [Cladorrhinum sp. PSN259]|nr:hypothetical protein QBC43DRAFT_353008 [Cladorrhinum sp. PSN259]
MSSLTRFQYDSDSRDSQPGLEVVFEREGLEVATDREGKYPEVVPAHSSDNRVQSPTANNNNRFLDSRQDGGGGGGGGGGGSSSAYSRNKFAPLKYSEPGEPRRRRQDGGNQRGESFRRLWLVLAIIIGVLVVLGCIIGGVVGSREMKKAPKSNLSNPASASSTTTATTATTTSNTAASVAAFQSIIKQNSPLAATGWREGAFFHIWLFYQGADGVIRRSRYSSEGNKGWSKPENFTSIKTLASGSPSLAATANIAKQPPEISLYYLSPQSQLSGHRFQESSTQSSVSQITSLTSAQTPLSSSTKISAYHPVLIAQNNPSTQGGTIQYFRDWSFEGRSWENYTLPQNVDAFPGTGLVLLPTAVTYQDAAGFLYVNNKGELSTYLSSSNGSNVDGWAWSNGPTGVAFPTNKTNSMGGFVYGRTKNLVNTYVLFVGDDGKLYDAHQDENGWKGPVRAEGLDKVVPDKATEIACVTMALWELTEVRLSGQKDMNRCFLQSGGKVREVWFDGAGWRDVGEVPLLS